MATKTKAAATTEAKVEEPLSQAALEKYKAAAKIGNAAVAALLPKLVAGANVLELCKATDEAIEAESAKAYTAKGSKAVQKGIAYPTSIAINSTLCHFSPLSTDPVAAVVTLNDGDSVKVVLGAHIDGYACLSGETIIVGASPCTGEKANLIAAAYNAVEAGLRCAKVGGKNMEVTDGISKVLAEFGGSIKGVEGMISNQHTQNDIQGRKTIHPFPTSEQRRDSGNSFIFEEGEVYHLDVAVSNSTNAASKPSIYQSTIYSKTGTSKYALKMKASRTVYSEISNKAGQFAYTLRMSEEETKARLGVTECVQHGLLKAYEPLQLEKPTDQCAQFLVTFALTKNGVVRLSSPPVFYSTENVKPDHEIKDESLKQLLAKPLEAPKKKKNKKPKDEAAPANGEATTEEATEAPTSA